MAVKQTVVWVAVPNGTGERGVYRLSVMAFPRLFPAAGSTVLGDFADFVNWPGQSEGVGITVDFGGGVTVKAKRVGRKPDMPSWSVFFDRSTPVDPYDQPTTIPHTTLAYPAARMHSYLRTKYREVGRQSPWSPPIAQSLITRFHDVAPAVIRQGQVSDLLYQTHTDFTGRGYVDDFRVDDGPARDWLRTKLFLRPPAIVRDDLNGTAKYQEADLDQEQPGTEVKLEFHQMIGILSQHPDLLRRYGLVMDYEFSAPAGMQPFGALRVIPKWSSSKKVATTNATPLTHYGEGFLPAPRPENAEDIAGWLIDVSQKPLPEQNRYELVHVDLENGLFKLQKTVERLPQRAGEPVTLPSLTTGGLSLVRKSTAWREAEWRRIFNENYDARINHPETLDIYAEDLLNGFRVDIGVVRSDDSVRWHSLHQRTTAYVFTRSKPLTMEFTGEGWVSPAVAELVPGVAAENLMVPAMARWTGWSLSAPQEPQPLEADEILKFGVQYRVMPGTLPLLRFGNRYRMRLRTVNIAGNGLPFDPNAPTDGATPAVTYRRHELVHAPAVIPTRSLKPEENTDWPGESVERLVVRSEGESMLTDGADRHLAPAPISAALCETHGLLDGPTGPSPAKVAMAWDREQISPPPVANGNTLQVDWLPDPLARGAALQNLPGASKIYKPDFYTDMASPITADSKWPDRKGVRLIIKGIILKPDLTWEPKEPAWDPINRTLTVYIAQSEQVTVPLSSYFTEQDLDLMAVWEMITEGADAGTINQLKIGALDGRHWMLTPSRSLTLVHAVQKPLQSPDFQTIGASRSLGETTALLSGVVGIHGKSTSEVDVAVQWTEPVDDPASDEPVWTGGAGQAVYVPVNDLNARTVGVESRFDFRDTKHRKLVITATAESRFGEFFPAGTDLTLQGESVEVDLPNTARPLAPKILYVVPTFGWERPESNDAATKRSIRWGGGLRVYLDRPWYSTGEGEMLAVILYDQPSGGLGDLIRRPEVPENLKTWVTVWGSDPLWRSRDTHAVPRLAHFKSALATQNGLTLEEAGSAPVLIAGHMVQYDAATGRWYCDIEVDAGPAYFPFIRLALARYQPNSVPGAHLSPVVTADIVQTAPSRTATVSRLSATACAVAVSGETYSAGRAGPAVVEATLEQATPAYGGDLLSWAAVIGADARPLVFGLKREGLAWVGTVDLPEPPSETVRYRLIVREYEQLVGDNGPIRRLVYADAIEL